jgi:FKBP-type peptidyl-prolyl cis-trans isomerase SlyD
MKEIIQKNKYVELIYKTVDKKTGDVYTSIEYPVGYVHGTEDSILSAEVIAELAGESVGDIIEIPIDCDALYGPRDESLVFTDHIENVPEEYREVGMTVTMENDKGEPKNFIVTRFDDKTLTIDGNNPHCGRDVVFTLEITMVRDATEEEIALGGKADADPSLDEILKN